MSIVIPARNEEVAIGRCLEALFAAPVQLPVQVVLVANGCTDATAERARSFSERAERNGFRLDVIEVELDVPSKVAALAAGEQHAVHGMRAYLDADVLLSPGAIDRIAEMLDQPGLHLVTPRVVMAPTGGWIADSYAQVWMRSPAVTERVVGAGFYAVSAEGRGRWDTWPEVHSDDKFVRLHFREDEQAVVQDATMTLSMPTDFREMIRIRARWCRGNQQLAEQFPGLDRQDNRRVNMLRTGLMVLRTPSLWRYAPGASVVYAAGWLLAWTIRSNSTWTSPTTSPIREPATADRPPMPE